MSHLFNRKDKLETFAYRKVFWPLDLLKKDFPDCRIWTYGYDRESLNEHAGATPELLANLRWLQFYKNLIFITHDLGGLLVKRALVHAWSSTNSVDQDIKRYTKGVVFFGTPHRSLDDRVLDTILQKLSSTTGADFDTPNLDVNVINTCNNKFSKLVVKHSLQILNIQEGDRLQISHPSNASSLV